MPLLLLAVLLSAANAAEPAGSIDVWTRAPGDYTKSPAPARQRPKTFRFEGRELDELSAPDLQYGPEPQRYRGVRISRILQSYGVPKGNDLALLYFQNGMVVPLPLAPHVMARVDARVALKTWSQEGSGAGELTSVFPDVTKRGASDRDRRPLQLQGNKLVVGGTWHPHVPATSASFSPWLHVDSLIGIELVQARAYERQFEMGQGKVLEGQAVFLGHCQYCHGARTVGARYGWDFVRPIALHSHRNPENLFLHLRYREGDAPERGLMMPAFKELGHREAEAVHAWLKALAEGTMPAYAP